MQGRSWMAALTLVAGTALVLHPHARAADAEKTVAGKVRLDLAIAGLGRDGCDVEVKPGHAGCRFRPVTQHVDSRGKATLILKDVETRSADRDCAFAITIKEAGHPVRTVHRGMRLTTPGEGTPGGTPSMSCFLSSPSKIARAESSRTRR